MNRSAYHRKYHTVNKERINAEKKVRYAIKVGKTQVGACVECQKESGDNVPVFEDYSDTSKYQWFCKSCKASMDSAYEQEVKLVEARIDDDKFYRRFG